MTLIQTRQLETMSYLLLISFTVSTEQMTEPEIICPTKAFIYSTLIWARLIPSLFRFRFIPNFLIPSLASSSSASNFAVVNRHLSSLQSLSCSSLVSLSHPTHQTSCHKLWIYHTTCPCQVNQFIILYTDIIPHTNQTGRLSKSWIFKDASLSKLNNTVKNNSIFNTKRAAVIYKMVGYILNFLPPTCS